MSDVPHDPHNPYAPSEDSSGGGYVELSKDAKNWAMLAHLSGLLIYLIPGVGHIVGPLIIWLMKKDEHPFIDVNGKEALNFQISMSIYMLVGLVSILSCVFFWVVPVLVVVDSIFSIIAAIKASNGEAYEYPLTIRLVK
jgi:uncharacterized Tic20 family protein